MVAKGESFGTRTGKRASLLAFSLVLTTVLTASSVAQAKGGGELARLRNLGQAFYENPATQMKAVEVLSRALELKPDSVREQTNYGLALLRMDRVEEGIAFLEKAQRADPSIPHTWFNLGIAFKRSGRNREAMAQLRAFIERIPMEPAGHYNLGVLQLLENEESEGVQSLQRAAQLGPTLAAPHFQLATAYRKLGRTHDSAREMRIFREAKTRQQDAAVTEDLEWCYYAELYDVVEQQPIAPVAQSSFEAGIVARDLGSGGGLLVIDPESDGRPDLLVWSEKGLALLAGGSEPGRFGVPDVHSPVSVAAGDWDDDGQVDLAVSFVGKASEMGSGVEIFRNAGVKLEKAFRQAASAGPLVWLDYDHDYDLDLFVFGESSVLLRNQGLAGFVDTTVDFPFRKGLGAVEAAVRVDLQSDNQGADLVALHSSSDLTVYRDRLQGNYEAETIRTEVRGMKRLHGADVDADGWVDLVLSSADRVSVFRNMRGDFDATARVDLPLRPVTDSKRRAPPPLTLADLSNRSLVDFVVGDQAFHNRGRLEFSELENLNVSFESEHVAGIESSAAADFDGDGRLELALLAAGRVHLLNNTAATESRWLSVRLEGVRGLKLAAGAEVEVKAGNFYRKQLYRGWPLLFGVGDRKVVDTVRITWPNGLVQNEVDVATGQRYEYREAQRLSGSCPMIFTWNGSEFEFVTDVLGVAPLGASSGDGEVFAVDHDEIIRISSDSLVEGPDGDLEIRITEELREVAYIDQIRLVAVDHPADVDVFTNEKFKAPPFPEPRLYAVGERRAPLAARDHHGHDVLERLLATDRRYVDHFERSFGGVAETHALELEFDRGFGEVLVLDGWVDWADGSTFRQQSQESEAGLTMPTLKARIDGRWQTIDADMGMPAGKPKTIVVDVSKIASRELRIESSVCLYWDRVVIAELLDEDHADQEIISTELEMTAATLKFRGFSEVEVHPLRLQPERFVYANVHDSSNWNPTAGMYTKYGEIRELLRGVDDRLVVMGSGDEIRLRFAADNAPLLETDRRRHYLLYVDGWAKDADANTAASQSVEPLPHHGMSTYPYPPRDGLGGDSYERYRHEYLTRPALRLIRPLAGGTQNLPDRATQAER